MGSGLTPAVLASVCRGSRVPESPLRMSWRQFDVLHRNVFRLTDRPEIGLFFGLEMNLSRWGLVATVLQSARTLGHALALADEFRSMMRSRFDLRPETCGDNVVITVHRRKGLDFPVNEAFAHEFLVGSLQTQIANLLGAPFRFEAIHWLGPPPSYAGAIVDRLQCPIQWGAPTMALIVPQETLQKPLPFGNPVVLHEARRLCEQERERIDRLQAGDVAGLVKRVLDNSRGPPPDMATVAAALNRSTRTLRRQLEAAGTPFRDLNSQHQLRLALQALDERALSLGEVARRSGFRDERSFREAFRRWTGMNPRAYRASSRA